MIHPIDKHVGSRIRHGRWLLGMSQIALAEKIGVKFQQVQKYETGANRISASRLFEVAKALDQPITYFFEGSNYPAQPAGPKLDHDAAEVLRVVMALPPSQRQAVMRLARSMEKESAQ